MTKLKEPIVGQTAISYRIDETGTFKWEWIKTGFRPISGMTDLEIALEYIADLHIRLKKLEETK